jgi:hypothetical protein
MLIFLGVVFFVFIGFYIVSGILCFVGIDLFEPLFKFLLNPLFDFFGFLFRPLFDFFDFLSDFFDSIEKSTLRIIGRVALLLVVMGFFMPIGCNQNGFQIAEYGMNIDKSIGAMTGSTSGVGVWLYVLFFVSLIGGLMIIPLVMKKKIHIGIDWVSLIIPVVCVIVLLSKLKDITGGSLGDLKLQIGGNV